MLKNNYAYIESLEIPLEYRIDQSSFRDGDTFKTHEFFQKNPNALRIQLYYDDINHNNFKNNRNLPAVSRTKELYDNQVQKDEYLGLLLNRITEINCFRFETKHCIFKKHGGICYNYKNIPKIMINICQISQCEIWGTGESPTDSRKLEYV
ncbi:hypothetical protein ALC53_00128 [Atta colombica]|uniref:Uncharacterized protein n=1 Tax=Atta colombica TaxID=520822 RepID=A0A195BX86_9HYME|nr:hypothetical protein ALC53_00128 [Atta colombica]